LNVQKHINVYCIQERINSSKLSHVVDNTMSNEKHAVKIISSAASVSLTTV